MAVLLLNYVFIILPSRCDRKSLSSDYHHQSRRVSRCRGRLKRLVASWETSLMATRTLRTASLHGQSMLKTLCDSQPLVWPHFSLAVDNWFLEWARGSGTLDITICSSSELSCGCLKMPTYQPWAEGITLNYIGPFTIFKQVNLVKYQLQLFSHYRIHPTFHVSMFKPPVSSHSTASDGPQVRGKSDGRKDRRWRS